MTHLLKAHCNYSTRLFFPRTLGFLAICSLLIEVEGARVGRSPALVYNRVLWIEAGGTKMAVQALFSFVFGRISGRDVKQRVCRRLN